MQNLKFHEENVCGSGSDDEFLDTTWKSQYLKKNLVGWTSLNFKNFALWKLHERMKTQVNDWEKICAKCISDKGLTSKLYKEFLKSK